MKLISDKEELIFRKDYEGKVIYSKSISHKLQDGSWEHGYIPVRFPKGVNIANKTKIKIKEAWDDFYIKEGKTNVYYFINKFELADDLEAMKQVAPNEVQFDDGDYPF